VQKSNIFNICVQIIPHELKCKLEDMNITAWLLHRWSLDHLIEMFPIFDQMWPQLGDIMNPLVAVYMLLQLTPNLGWKLTVAGHSVGAMKSGASRVNSCTVFTCPMGSSIVLSASVTSGLVDSTKTELFCCRYLKINNYIINEYFLTKFCHSFKDIFRIHCT